jgi:hypothetical protein
LELREEIGLSGAVAGRTAPIVRVFRVVRCNVGLGLAIERCQFLVDFCHDVQSMRDLDSIEVTVMNGGAPMDLVTVLRGRGLEIVVAPVADKPRVFAAG